MREGQTETAPQRLVLERIRGVRQGGHNGWPADWRHDCSTDWASHLCGTYSGINEDPQALVKSALLASPVDVGLR